jgi:hypothetical protein
MTRTPNVFVDPAGIFADYNWPINHDGMSPSGRKRNTTATAPTSGIGTVRQQGSEAPLGLVLTGTMLTEDQRRQMIFWWTLCRTQTIFFYEFSSEQYEVIITDYEETKVPVFFNRNDPSIPYHIYTYTLTMDIIKPLSGSWEQAAP